MPGFPRVGWRKLCDRTSGPSDSPPLQPGSQMSAPFPASNNGPNGQDPDDEKVTVPLNYGDDLWSRFKNYTNLSFDRLNREDVERFYQLEEFRRWATMHENCMKQRSELMRKSEYQSPGY